MLIKSVFSRSRSWFPVKRKRKKECLELNVGHVIKNVNVEVLEKFDRGPYDEKHAFSNRQLHKKIFFLFY